MQLETIKHSLFALGALEAATVFGGAIAPTRTWEYASTFLYDGTVVQDAVQVD